MLCIVRAPVTLSSGRDLRPGDTLDETLADQDERLSLIQRGLVEPAPGIELHSDEQQPQAKPSATLSLKRKP
jgi:hypothetical protein